MSNNPTAKNANVTEGDRALLHWPARQNCLMDLESHLATAARLSGSLFMALQDDDNSIDDRRTRSALTELASVVADHTSAAEFLFNTQPDYGDVRA